MCRMLLALGNIEPKIIIEDAALMAKDLTFDHEHNASGRGVFAHGHGWGIAYTKRNKFQVDKSVKAIYKDTNRKLYHTLSTNFLLIHARQATVGKTQIHNTHPFYFVKKRIGSFIFCHNGTIKETIKHNHHFKVQGTTDSEQLFYAILTHFLPSKDPKTIPKTINEYSYPIGCNVILATQTTSYININCHSCPKYVEMHMLQQKDKLIISSEPLPHIKGTWKELPSGTLLKIDNKTRAVKNLTPDTPKILSAL